MITFSAKDKNNEKNVAYGTTTEDYKFEPDQVNCSFVIQNLLYKLRENDPDLMNKDLDIEITIKTEK